MAEQSSELAGLLARQQHSSTCLAMPVPPAARRKLVQWMLQLVRTEGERLDLVSLAVRLLDLLQLRVPLALLQSLAGAALVVASKVRGGGLTVTLVCQHCPATSRELREWELLILTRLQFSVSRLTPHDFLPALSSLLAPPLPPDPGSLDRCSRLVTEAAADPGLGATPPASLAAAALLLCRPDKEDATTRLGPALGLSARELQVCATQLEQLQVGIQEQEQQLQEQQLQETPNDDQEEDGRRLATPDQEEFCIEQSSLSSSTPSKLTDKQLPESSETQSEDNNDSAIALSSSFMESLSLSPLPSSPSSSGHSSTKSSPDSGTSLHSRK